MELVSSLTYHDRSNSPVDGPGWRDRACGMQAEGAKAPPDCRRIVIRLRYGIKGRCDRWATCTGEECLVNVHHAKSRLILETCGHSGQKTRARRQPARTGCGPSSATCNAERPHAPCNKRAISQGDERSITANPGHPSCLIADVIGHDRSNSQADNLVRDQEAADSNPATPKAETQVVT